MLDDVRGRLETMGGSVVLAVASGEGFARLLEAGDASVVVAACAGAGRDEAAVLAGRLRAVFPEVEVGPVDGGQPHYCYLIAAE